MTPDTAQAPRRAGVRRSLIVTVCLLLPIAAHAVWDQVEATRLSRAVRAIQKRGEPVNSTEIRRPLDTDEQREASRLYSAAAMLASPKVPEELRVAGRSWTGKASEMLAAAVQEGTVPGPGHARLPELQAAVDSVKPALTVLDLATPLDFRKFAPERSGYSYQIADLSQLAALNSLRTDLLSLRGDAAAATSHLGSVRLLRTLGTTTLFAPGTLASLALLLERTVPTDAELVALQRAYEERGARDALADALIQHRALLLESVWPDSYGRSSWVQRIRSSADGRPLGTSVEFIVLRPFVTHRLIDQLHRLDDDIRIARLPWPQKIDAMNGQRSSFRIGVANVIWIGQKLAGDGVAVAVLATERYRRAHGGALPASLDALVPAYLAAVPIDPFSGTSVRFLQESAGYTIYSVGANRQDDRGKLGRWESDVSYKRSGADAAVDEGIHVPLHPRS